MDVVVLAMVGRGGGSGGSNNGGDDSGHDDSGFDDLGTKGRLHRPYKGGVSAVTGVRKRRRKKGGGEGGGGIMDQCWGERG